METKFNFKSQICTTREQSERLLALGLKKETADMFIWIDNSASEARNTSYIPKDYFLVSYREHLIRDGSVFIPAWSLHRLIKMMPKVVWYKDVLERKYHPIVEYESVNYVTEDGTYLFDEGNDVWESMIVVIKWLIKEGYFNKEYLEE